MLCVFFLRRDSRHLYVSWYFEIQTTRLIMFFVIHMYMFWHNNKDAFFQCCDSVSFWSGTGSGKCGSGFHLKSKKIPNFFFNQKYNTQNYDFFLLLIIYNSNTYINQKSDFFQKIFLYFWSFFCYPSPFGSIFPFHDTDPNPAKLYVSDRIWIHNTAFLHVIACNLCI